jgi:hypothetical protein
MELTTLDSLQLVSNNNNRLWYHELNRNSNTLLITVGDSWTWGDSLGKTTPKFDDYDYRTTHIYGHILSDRLSSDFINVGLPGGSNFYILLHLELVLASLKKKYKNVKLVFTLTESGRELQSDFENNQKEYQSWQGPDWPTFDQIIAGNFDPSKLKLVLDDTNNTNFGRTLRLFTSLHSAKNLEELFYIYEQVTFDILTDYFKNFSIDWTLARNFTSSFPSNTTNSNGHLINTRWTDIIAKNGNLDQYPSDIFALSLSMSIQPMIKMANKLGIGSVHEYEKLLDKSIDAIGWLDHSPYNAKMTHPLAQGHRWWAEYLYHQIA